jgi:hypothetical protein
MKLSTVNIVAAYIYIYKARLRSDVTVEQLSARTRNDLQAKAALRNNKQQIVHLLEAETSTGRLESPVCVPAHSKFRFLLLLLKPAEGIALLLLAAAACTTALLLLLLLLEKDYIDCASRSDSPDQPCRSQSPAAGTAAVHSQIALADQKHSGKACALQH